MLRAVCDFGKHKKRLDLKEVGQKDRTQFICFPIYLKMTRNDFKMALNH